MNPLIKKIRQESYGYSESMSDNAFLGLIGLISVWGFALIAFVSNEAMLSHWQPSTAASIGLVILSFVGIIMTKSESAANVLVGFHLALVTLALILAPALAESSPDVVRHVAILTAGVACLMAGLGLTFPRFFESLASGLLLSLVALIGVRLLGIFFPVINEMSVIDWVSAALFALFIGADMARAVNDWDRGFSSAMRHSLGVILSVLNLFLSILSGKSKR